MNKLSLLLWLVQISPNTGLFSPLQFYDRNVTLNDVITNCPNFSPEQFTPKLDEALKLTARLSLWRFLHIDNAAEEMAFAGLLEIKWLDARCANERPFANMTKTVKLNPRPDMFWTPSVIIVQSEQNTLMSGDRKESLGLVVTPSRGKTPVQFNWKWAIRGVFRFHCDLDLFLFPNDVQNCTIQFQTDEIAMIYNFSECFINFDSENVKFTLSNSNWNLVSTKCNIGYGFAITSVVTISFEMARNPRYFMTHVVTPCLLLLVLELCSFALPANGAERTGFTMTIYLAFVFMESIMVTILPQTPRQILVADLVMLQSIFSTIITVYSALLSKFANRLSKSKVAIGKFRKITWLTIVDSAAFSFSILAYIVVSFWMTWQYHNGPSY